MVCQAAFKKLKKLFANEPKVRYPDPNEPFIIQAEASDVAVGGDLLPKKPTGSLIALCLHFLKLSNAERRWKVWEKEAYAVR